MNDAVFISAQDLKNIYRRYKKWFFRIAAITAMYGFFYSIQLELLYKAQASFQQGGSGSMENIGAAFPLQLMQGLTGGSKDLNAAALMRSRFLTAQVVQEMGLQIEEATPSYFKALASRIVRNVAFLTGSFQEDHVSFVFGDVRYDQEMGTLFYLRFISVEEFEVLDSKERVCARGKIDEPVKTERFSFTLVSLFKNLEYGRLYKFRIAPLFATIDEYLKCTDIQTNKTNPGFLQLRCLHPNRTIACSFLDHLTVAYQGYLKDNHKEKTSQQLFYLENRLHEMSHGLEQSLQDQAAFMRHNLQESGFLQIADEAASFNAPQQKYLKKSNAHDLELSRYDSLTMELIGSSKDRLLALELEEKKEEFPVLEQLNQVHAQIEELQKGVVALDNQTPLGETLLAVTSNEKSVVELVKKYQESVSFKTSINSDARDQLKSYLTHLIRLLSQKEKILQENLTVQISDPHEFHGIPLELAQKLFLDYQGQLDTLQVGVKQLLFVKNQLEDPYFDLSSLGTLPSDPITREMVHKAGELQMQLHDDQNRMGKEQKRLQEALAAQKKFLSFHLTQTVGLQQLHLKLIEQKISRLKQTTRHLIKVEKELIEQRLFELRKRLAPIPDKWLQENRFKLESSMCRGKIEGMVQLIESKNLEGLLFQVESKSLDLAFAPVTPERAPFLFHPFLGAFSSCLLLFGAFVVRTLFRGAPVTKEGLKIAGFTNQAELSSCIDLPFSKLGKKELEVVRQLCVKIGNSTQVVTLIHGKYPDYSANLAELLGRRGEKVILVSCFFDQIPTEGSKPGFFQFLSGAVDLLPIEKKEHYDSLSASGRTLLGAELIASEKFIEMLQLLKEKYSKIILATHASVDSQEAYNFTKISDQLLITMAHERPVDAEQFLPWINTKGKEALLVLLYPT